MVHICCMNTITVQRSAAPLVFTNTQRWPLLAPAPGYIAVHHGPLPQAGIQGGKCLQGDSDQTDCIHSYQSISTSVCTIFYKSQQLESIHSQIFIWCKNTLASDQYKLHILDQRKKYLCLEFKKICLEFISFFILKRCYIKCHIMSVQSYKWVESMFQIYKEMAQANVGQHIFVIQFVRGILVQRSKNINKIHISRL